MVSHTDSLTVALTNICFGLVFVALTTRRRRLLSTLAALSAAAMILLMQNEVYLDTGWLPLENASRAALVAMIILAIWRYARKELAVEEDEEAGREDRVR